MVTQEIVNDCAGNYEWPRRKKNRLRNHFCTRAQVEKTLNYTLVNFALCSICSIFALAAQCDAKTAQIAKSDYSALRQA
jgi:hypothetical protein